MTAYTLLERFNFAGAKQMTKIRDLSGGEQRRLGCCRLALCPNLLILDEPTNDLDLDTIEALEEMLADFDGCVLVVSHDRAFVDNLVDHIFVFDGRAASTTGTGASAARCLKKMDDERLAPRPSAARDPDAPELTEELAAEKARKQRERDVLKEAHNAPSVIDKIERALAVLEEDIEAIDARLLACGSDVSAAQEVQLEKDAKAAKQDLYMAEWERLEGVLAEAEAIKAEHVAREEASSVSAR